MSHRFRLVAAVLDEAARTGNVKGVRLDGVLAEYRDLDSFLLALHHRWWTAVYAQLDRVLEDPPEDLGTAVRAVWGELAGRQPGLRVFLDAYAGHPVLASVERRQCERLRADLGVELDVALAVSGQDVSL
jgi:hypothetical protein